jgi:fatty-acyl-CoA synthase
MSVRNSLGGPMDRMSFEPLTPTSFLDRSAAVFAGRTAVVDGDARRSYAELGERTRRQAGMLRALGVEPGDRVAVLAPNTTLLLESHFGVPYAGAVLVALNLRLTAGELGYILAHSAAKVLLVDGSLGDLGRAAAAEAATGLRIVEAPAEYEALLAGSDELVHPVHDELGLLALDYTSGTTGRPKGVEYHHRGAYLQALAMAYHSRLDASSVFLWTLPMFHCNGWCFPWAVTAAGSVHLCLPSIDTGRIWRHIREDGVTHFNAAPTVLTMLASDPAAAPAPVPVRVATGGAPPSPTLLARMAELNIDVTHLYGLTETFGPAAICEWSPDWDALDASERARLKARQGVANVVSRPLRVVDDKGDDVPADGLTMGQVALRGNNVMRGYYRDADATTAAAPNGWFLTGDLGVMHADGYVELKDRAKDVIISGGENISTIEIEQVIATHPAVLEVAVVSMPDERWGEVPAAFVAPIAGAEVTEAEIVDHVRARLARFKAPKQVVFGPLPKTSTGKIQKYVLREQVWGGRDRRIH